MKKIKNWLNDICVSFDRVEQEIHEMEGAFKNRKCFMKKCEQEKDDKNQPSFKDNASL